ncbi:hypothetical protein NC653_010973 [Populus alba x Populus x berolinensis]|uniref:Uncharacterized protein n=1 Tax=Populus alba x Populus x berolinensis TaxID=444605 RepID=A0AAD6W5T0_9ROSI|nr:hypothetical protein NC653_010973 [Populus alba x Populus x berolinensis]
MSAPGTRGWLDYTFQQSHCSLIFQLIPSNTSLSKRIQGAKTTINNLDSIDSQVALDLTVNKAYMCKSLTLN